MKRSEWFFILCLLLFAAGLRIIGIAYGQPIPEYEPTNTALNRVNENIPIQPDEYMFLARPIRMVVTRQLNPKFFANPSFLMNLNFFTILLTNSVEGLTYEDIEGVSERSITPFPLYVVSRTYSVLGGLVGVAAIYAIARRIAGPEGAMGAGLLAATAFPLVQHGHYMTTNSIAMGFASVAIWASLTCLYRPRWWMYLLACIATGFAAGSRYNAVLVAGLVGVTGLILIYRRHSWKTVVAGWLLVPAVFTFTTPHIIFDTEFFISQVQYILSEYLLGVDAAFTTPYGLFFEYRYLILFGLGAPAAVIALIGILGALRQSPPLRRLLDSNSPLLIVLLLGAYILPYSLVVLRTVRPGHSDQLLVPILPAFILLVGIGTAWLYKHIRLPSTVLAPALALAITAIPLVLSVTLVRQFEREDTRYMMQAWIETHIPHGSIIHLNGPYNVPLDAAHYEVTQNFGGDYVPLESLRAAGVEYMVMSDAWQFDAERSHEIVSLETLQEIRDYVASFSGLPVIASIERPQWTGYDWMMHTATIWHHPGLTVYCLICSSGE